MSAITMAVSVEGLIFEDWQGDFQAHLASSAHGFDISSEVAGAVGALGAKRLPSVKVRGTATSEHDGAIKVLGLVIASLSLAISAAQFVRQGERHPDGPVFDCHVTGPKGVHEIHIEGAAIPSEALLRKCLDATGVPTHVKAVPQKRH